MDPFATVFGSLRGVFAFEDALALVEKGDRFECISATSAALVGLSWPRGDLFAKVAGGRVIATFSSHAIAEWKALGSDLISPDQPALYMPIQMRSDRGLVILVQRGGAAGYTRDDVALARKFTLLASHALALRHSMLTETESSRLRQLSEELTRRAYYDDLTGLPNRALIQQRVEHRLARGNREAAFALAFIDLDDFKRINDYYSHAIGDAVLIEVAQRISSHVRGRDMLARISGDEFVLMLDSLRDKDDVRRVIDRILTEIRKPLVIESYEIFTSASIGVSFYPDHGEDYESLRRNADNAMYRAKSEAKGSAAYFDTQMGQALTARMELEQRLRVAIRDRQFHAAFQPKIDLARGRVAGFEALIRWRDAHGVIRPPGTFVGLATELGLIGDITLFVLESSAAAFSLLDPVFGGHTTISINLAAQQACDMAFVSQLGEALAQCGHAHRLMLELTEEAFIASRHFQSQVLPMLRDLGVKVSIDDFGTGYSSLAVLADITADEIKVDRSFITQIQDRPRSQSILRAIESLAHPLGMSLVAEGVETAAELNYLARATSIRMVQGFHFARPMDLPDLVQAAPALQTAAGAAPVLAAS
ncbi:putative bifunctional diguanylate cyclase/phosphodiesterase [Zavarzinia sp. CC-PAN008]|uniref:putative bifunctional diguanylate cyclase/phosphodiesterase n=1 Tax=Zavarzinia sp. CC-PAN008 TaxID=3243332 RepID=UPI003F742487